MSSNHAVLTDNRYYKNTQIYNISNDSNTLREYRKYRNAFSFVIFLSVWKLGRLLVVHPSNTHLFGDNKNAKFIIPILAGITFSQAFLKANSD